MTNPHITKLIESPTLAILLTTDEWEEAGMHIANTDSLVLIELHKLIKGNFYMVTTDGSLYYICRNTDGDFSIYASPAEDGAVLPPLGASDHVDGSYKAANQTEYLMYMSLSPASFVLENDPMYWYGIGLNPESYANIINLKLSEFRIHNVKENPLYLNGYATVHDIVPTDNGFTATYKGQSLQFIHMSMSEEALTIELDMLTAQRDNSYCNAFNSGNFIIAWDSVRNILAFTPISMLTSAKDFKYEADQY